MYKWIIYTSALGFTAYWASNLLLWFPWSYSTTLGITLMLTVSPVLWAYASYLALKTYPSSGLIKGASLVALVFLVLAVIMDFIFFGIIRNAMEELYHPTTFYGYGFLMVLPILIAFIYRKKKSRSKGILLTQNVIKTGVTGFVLMLVLSLIIILEITI